MKRIVFMIVGLMFSAALFAAPYLGVNEDVNHGTTNVVLGYQDLIGPFGVEATHMDTSVVPAKFTVCGHETCATNSTVKNTLAATFDVPLAFGLSVQAKGGVAPTAGYVYGAGIGYAYTSHVSFRADLDRYQNSGVRQNVPTLGVQVNL